MSPRNELAVANVPDEARCPVKWEELRLRDIISIYGDSVFKGRI